MRVLIVSQYFWPEPFRINDLAAGLRERQHEVIVLTGVPNYPQGSFYPGYGIFSDKETMSGIAIRRVPLIPRGKSKGLQLVANYVSFAVLASILGPLRCRTPFDVILVFQPSPISVALPAIVLKRLRNVPLLIWVQDLWPETLSATGIIESAWILRQVDRCARAIYRRCDRVLIQSKAFMKHVERQGVPMERIDYIPNWAEQFYQPKLLADAAPCPELPSGFRILFAGNIGVSQSFQTILDAAHLIRNRCDIQWIVLGEGREGAWVEEQIQRRQLSRTVHLLGPRPAETMPWYFASADALLVSLKRGPAFAMTIPSKLQSYLACGRPILASLDGAGAEIVEEARSGLVSPAEDSQALAQNALRLAESDPGERMAMGRNGREYFERHFDRKLILDRLESIMKQSTESQSCAA